MGDANLERLVHVLMCRGLIDQNDAKYINFEMTKDEWSEIPFRDVSKYPDRIKIRRQTK